MKKTEIFLHVSALESSKLRVLKENQILKFDIKEDKDKLLLLTSKKFNLSRVSSLVARQVIT